MRLIPKGLGKMGFRPRSYRGYFYASERGIMPRETFGCDRQSYGHKPGFIQGKLAAGQNWYKAKVTYCGGDHFEIEYSHGQSLLLHNHDPHGLLTFNEKYGQKEAKYEPKFRLLTFGARGDETYLYSFSPTELVPCFEPEALYF